MLIKCQVTPKAKLNQVVPTGLNSYRVKTTAAATDNQANQAVIELMAKYLKIKKAQIFIKSGQTSRYKILAVFDSK